MPNQTSDFTEGDIVMFGLKHGEKTRGEVVKVNPKRLKIKQLESRGTMKSHPVGTIWTVPPIHVNQTLARPMQGRDTRDGASLRSSLIELLGVSEHTSDDRIIALVRAAITNTAVG